jgi:hypothetical protein
MTTGITNPMVLLKTMMYQIHGLIFYYYLLYSSYFCLSKDHSVIEESISSGNTKLSKALSNKNMKNIIDNNKRLTHGFGTSLF